MLDRDNTPLGFFPGPEHDIGLQKISTVRSAGSTTVVSRSLSVINGNNCSTTNRLDIYDEVGIFIATAIAETKETKSRGMTIDTGREFNGLATCWDISDDGRLYVAPHFNEYRILVYDRSGAKERIIQTEYESVRRSAENMADLKHQKDSLRRTEGVSEDINPFLRDIDSLYCRPNGELWVLSSQGLRDCSERQLGIFHVYGHDGHYLHDVSLEADYDPKRDDFLITGNRLFILKEAQMMPATVSTASFGNSMVMTASHGPENDEGDDNEARPFSVICYEL